MNTKIFVGLLTAIVAIGILATPISAFATKNVDVDLATTDSSAGGGTYSMKLDKGNDCDPLNSPIATFNGQFNNNFANHLFSNQAINTGDLVCVGAFVQDANNGWRWGFEYTTQTAGSGGTVSFTGIDKLLLTEHTP